MPRSAATSVSPGGANSGAGGPLTSQRGGVVVIGDGGPEDGERDADHGGRDDEEEDEQTADHRNGPSWALVAVVGGAIPSFGSVEEGAATRSSVDAGETVSLSPLSQAAAASRAMEQKARRKVVRTVDTSGSL